MALFSLLNWQEKREKAGAIKGRRREPTKIDENPEGFSKSVFKVPFLEILFKDIFWGSFRDVKSYSEQKRFLGQTF